MPLSGGAKCVKHADMAGGRKIIAIEGGADDSAANAAAVRLGKRLANEALVEDAGGGAALAAAGDDAAARDGWPIAPSPEESASVWNEDGMEAPRVQREWLGLALGGGLIAAWTGAFVTGNLSAFQQGQPMGVWTGLLSAWSTPVLVVSPEAK